MAAPVNPTTNGARVGHGSGFEPGPDSPVDLAIGSFSDDPPWVVDPATMTWRGPVDAVRWVTRRQVPDLVAPRRFPSGTRVFTVVRHLGPALALWALGARRRGGSESKSD